MKDEGVRSPLARLCASPICRKTWFQSVLRTLIAKRLERSVSSSLAAFMARRFRVPRNLCCHYKVVAANHPSLPHPSRAGPEGLTGAGGPGAAGRCNRPKF